MKRSQGMLVGSATTIVVVTLLAIYALDNPYRPGWEASNRAMERLARDPRRGVTRIWASPSTSVRRERHGAASDPSEVIATVLLALAAVATAWSGYQATRWNGEQTKAASPYERDPDRRRAAQGLAEAQKEVDVATFIQWVDAYAHRETELTTFYERRFRAEFKPAFDAWLATRPLTNPNAPLTPFVMPQYRLAAEEGGRGARRRGGGVGRHGPAQHPARVELHPRRRAVLGRALRRHEHEARRRRASARRSGGVGCVVFLGTVIWLATQPISFASDLAQGILDRKQPRTEGP